MRNHKANESGNDRKESGERIDECIDRICAITLVKYHRLTPAETFAFVVGIATLIVGLWAAGVYTAQYFQSTSLSEAQVSTQRPIMVATDVEHMGLLGNKDHFIHQIWTNTGATPATHVQISWTWTDKLPESFPTTFIRNRPPLFAVSPGVKLDDVIQLSEDDRKRINSAKRMYLIGKLTWGDYFPSTEGLPHEMRYCSELSELNMQVEAFSWNLVNPCFKFNCTDDDCKVEDEHR